MVIEADRDTLTLRVSGTKTHGPHVRRLHTVASAVWVSVSGIDKWLGVKLHIPLRTYAVCSTKDRVIEADYSEWTL